jgi:hypothetical protein
MFAQNTRSLGFAIHIFPEGEIVARCAYTIPTRDKGLNLIQAQLDPEHPKLAPFIVQFLLHKVTTLSPGRRVEFPVPHWMESLVTAAEKAGFERRLEYCHMGLELK